MGFFEVDLKEGSPYTGVAVVQELGGHGSFAGKLSLTGQSVIVFLDPGTDLSGISKVTLFGFGTLFRNGRFRLFQVSGSRVFLHGPFDATKLLRIKETCSGVGALGRGGDTMGYRVVALNEIQPETAKVAANLTQAGHPWGHQ